MRSELSQSAPAEWCLHAASMAGLADRLSFALTRTGPSAARCDYRRGDAVTVRHGTRWVEFSRAPAVPDVWGEWGWYGRCSDEDDLKFNVRPARDALIWALGWPA